MDRTIPLLFDSDERTLLEGMLDWYRAGVLAKVDGLSDEPAQLAVGGSETSVAGLVKHLALVEDAWFADLTGSQHPEPWANIDWESDPDWEFRTARDEPLSASVQLYLTAITRSRSVSALRPLGDLSPPGQKAPFSLRFALVHLIEETARHLGHLDILCERLDGRRGR
jgi:uncharacterized damage-inducible protein DinB